MYHHVCRRLRILAFQYSVGFQQSCRLCVQLLYVLVLARQYSMQITGAECLLLNIWRGNPREIVQVLRLLAME